MKFDEYEYTIAGHYLPYLINGDDSGLEDFELIEVHEFTVGLPEGGFFGDISDDSHFGEDEVSGLYADVYDVKYLVATE